MVVTQKLLIHARQQFHPVIVLHGSGSARTLFLLGQPFLETFHIHFPTLLGGHQLGEVNRETVGVKQFKSKGSVNHMLAILGMRGNIILKTVDAIGKRFQERLLFFLYNMVYQVALLRQFFVLVPHLVHQGVHQLVHEGLTETKEGIAVAHRTTQNAADDITGLGIAGQLAVGNAEGNCTQVVGNHAHCHVGLLLLAISPAGFLGNLLNEGLEDIGVIVRAFALHHHAEAFKAHAGIDMFSLEGFQGAVGKAVELHKHQVPYFNHQGVVLIHQLGARHLGFLCLVAQVHMNLAARATRALVAHFPEVVLLRTLQDAVFGNMLLPEVVSLCIHCQTFLLVTTKNGYIKIAFVNMHHLGEKFPSIGNGLFLKVVAKRPVAQHLKHGVMVGIVSHLLQVVVLAADTQTLLSVAGTRIRRIGIAQEDVFKLVHAGIGEHKGGVVLHDHGGTGYYMMVLALEELQELTAYFVRSHNFVEMMF